MKTPALSLALTAALALAVSGCATKPKTAPGAVAAAAPATSGPEGGTPMPGDVASAPNPALQAQFAAAAGGDRVFFAVDSHVLDQGARDLLVSQAAWLAQRSDVNALISGNADERGTREYNLALGARRADAARAFLISKGVSATRLTTISYGKERPVDPSSTEEAWAQNRNAQTVVMDIAQR